MIRRCAPSSFGVSSLLRASRRVPLVAAACVITLSVACGSQPGATPTPATQTPRPAPSATAKPTPTATAPATTEAAAVMMADLVPKVFVNGPGDAARHEGMFGEALAVGSELLTDETGRARLVFSDGATIRLGPGTRLVLTSQQESTDGGWLTQLNLWAGQVWVILQKGLLSVETPVGVAAVRGSFLSVAYFPGDPDNPADDQVVVTCLEGRCSLKADSGEIQLGTGQKIILVGVGSPPGDVGAMTQEDLDEWLANNPEVLLILQGRTGEPSETPSATETPTATPGGSTLPTAAPAASAQWPFESGRSPGSVVVVIAGVAVSALGRRWLKRR